MRLTKADAHKFGDGAFVAIADPAALGDEVAVNGFGKFKVSATLYRDGHNSSTGAKLKIATSKNLTFAPANAIKDHLSG